MPTETMEQLKARISRTEVQFARSLRRLNAGYHSPHLAQQTWDMAMSLSAYVTAIEQAEGKVSKPA